jgi:hypothetical protein
MLLRQQGEENMTEMVAEVGNSSANVLKLTVFIYFTWPGTNPTTAKNLDFA